MGGEAQTLCHAALHPLLAQLAALVTGSCDATLVLFSSISCPPLVEGTSLYSRTAESFLSFYHGIKTDL